eukprot:GFYU01000572.1.p1 GENE.GFYU01000572.1~~GFYU01000572.1.p1  ORF type:complete len:286 (+),score=101.33 GFYU01000572.1:113-859(+)
MDEVYTMLGVCPQDNLIWETLTAREHLNFYGKLKKLKGDELRSAVDAALDSVNLLNVSDKRAGAFSGGMKRRLSVAMSLIGDPKVVYLDEPSTGLDPASRRTLWDAILEAKKSRAVILTTHSMEEAEALCDRIGIFVDGELRCLGNPKELTSRYGGQYVLSIHTPPDREKDAFDFITKFAPRAKLTYALAGTQRFEIPTDDLEIDEVFETMESQKDELEISDWGMANSTLEDVFISVAGRGVDVETLK